MLRDVFEDDHVAFRQMVGAFVGKEIRPHYREWELAGRIPRDLFRRLGEVGILGIAVPAQYGGAGEPGYKYSAVLTEETMREGLGLGTVRVHMDIVLPYLLRYASEEQKQRWLPKVAAGDLVLAIAMTEPQTGSDLAGITTRAEPREDGYLLNGSKTFISGAVNADLVIVVARTSPPLPDNRRHGLSLLVVEKGMDGFRVGGELHKIGLRTQDTAELFFDDVHVPHDNLLGAEGEAFGYLGHNLPQERLSIAVGSQAAAQGAVAMAVDYVRDRRIFGRTLSEFQNTKFVLAECLAEVEAGQAVVDRALNTHERGQLSPVDAAKVKLFASELQGRVTDKCLQLFGGYGYILDYPIARMYADARVTRIYGGTSEVMKTIISKAAGL